METETVWIDGCYLSEAIATVSVRTHALHYGSSVFEGIRFYETASGRRAIFRLLDHLKRLNHSASILKLNLPSYRELTEAIIHLVQISSYREGYIRPLAFFGAEALGLDTRKLLSHCAIIILPWGKYLEKEAVRLKIASKRRISPDAANLAAKIGGLYALNIIAHREAVEAGFDEALLLDCYGNTAEGAGENIFFSDGKSLYTPNMKMILPGITRDSVISIATDSGYGIIYDNPYLFWNIDKDIVKYPFSEAFLTGTAAEITPIEYICDDTKNRSFTAPGQITTVIKQTFNAIIRGEHPLSTEWLTYVD